MGQLHEPDAERPYDDEKPSTYTCPWCGQHDQSTAHIRQCSGFQALGMPDNETGHKYGCACAECMIEYQRLK